MDEVDLAQEREEAHLLQRVRSNVKRLMAYASGVKISL